MHRIIKRIFIILIYILIIAAISFFVYWQYKPQPTCSDGQRNQGEEKIDCGGPCPPCQKEIKRENLEVIEKKFVAAGHGKYDLLAKVRNPNNDYGSQSFAYEFVLKDSAGKVLARDNGHGFILPAETKYILKINLAAEDIPASVEFNVLETKWETFQGYEKPQLNIYHKRYNLISPGLGYSEVYGLLRNESKFDFGTIKVNIVLRDSIGQPLALNSTQMMTVMAGEERDFRLFWPTSFPGEVSQVEIEAEADVFSNENFIKRYLPRGRFQ